MWVHSNNEHNKTILINLNLISGAVTSLINRLNGKEIPCIEFYNRNSVQFRWFFDSAKERDTEFNRLMTLLTHKLPTGSIAANRDFEL